MSCFLHYSYRFVLPLYVTPNIHLFYTNFIIVFQIRFLGQHAVSSHSCAEEVQILMDSVKELKNLVPPEASQAFQDGVEVHIKQIFNTLLKVRPQNP